MELHSGTNDWIMSQNEELIDESARFKFTRLSNQLIVGNFSSPHPFTFDDGSVLSAVSDYDSERLKVTFTETIIRDEHKFRKLHSDVSTVQLKFTLNEEIENEMKEWLKMWEHNDVDIVLCPLPMIQALQQGHESNFMSLLNSPFRAVRMKDRIKKLSSIDTFTI